MGKFSLRKESNKPKIVDIYWLKEKEISVESMR